MSLVPCLTKEKHPFVPWKQYQTAGPPESQVRQWFRPDGSDKNVAILTGAPSKNLVVIDCDSKDVYNRLFPHTPVTMVVETARGIHVYYRSWEPVPSFKFPEAHIDVKADGGLVIAPPSIHPSGAQYKFLNKVDEILYLDKIEESIRKAVALYFGVITSTVDLSYKNGIKERFRPYQWVNDPGCMKKIKKDGVEGGWRNEAQIRLASFEHMERQKSPDMVLFEMYKANEKFKPPLHDREIIQTWKNQMQNRYRFGCHSLVHLCVGVWRCPYGRGLRNRYYEAVEKLGV